MDRDDLDGDGVRGYYSKLVDHNPYLADIKADHEQQLHNDEEFLEVAEKEVDAKIEEGKKHDSLLTSTISAFLPEGPIEQETGWVFRGAEPLSEANEPNADAIFCNPDRNMALLVECKAGLSSPGSALSQVYAAAEAVRANKTTLSEHIGMEIEQLETAICVPSYYDEQIAKQIENEERNGEAQERVYLWRLHYLQEGEQLDLFTSFSNRTSAEATHESELSELLTSGVELTKERQVTPSFFPSSHTFQIMEASCAELIKKRLKRDEPLREFAADELVEILTSQRHLPHYAADTVGERIFGGLIDRLESDNLITEIDSADTELTDGSPFYRYRVRGRSVDTLIKNLKEKYKKQAVERKIETEAMEAAIDDFDEKQSSIDDF